MGITNAPIPITTLAHSALTGVTTAQHHTSPAPASSTNDAIARYDGVSGALQDYSSLAPTISDAGIVALTSGALKWPSTAIPSGDANTLDDYEEGAWTPVLWDNSLDSGEGQSYSIAVGRYVRIGNRVYVSYIITMSGLGTLTVSQGARIGGLPFTAVNTANVVHSFVAGACADLNSTAGYNVCGTLDPNTANIILRIWDYTGGNTSMLISELTAAGRIQMAGFYEV